MRIRTGRLTLVAATMEQAQKEFQDRARFAELLRAEVPPDWPPPLNDEASRRWVCDALAKDPNAFGWLMWYFLLRRPGEAPLLVGNGGFTGLPSADGTVEVGYAVVESCQRRGYAHEAVKALVRWVFSHPRVTRVVAHTLPELTPSIRVLEKCGSRRSDKSLKKDAIMFELPRPR
jgi:RimJ/RimL family protein N-acetyltransferase